jgi:two-component system, NtrC family, response regulator HydG
MTTKLRILIVDDDQRMTRTLSDILAIAGHTPTEVYSGEAARAKIEIQQFDCVLTDVRMPGMDGVEFHRQLRQVQPGLPVILMTAFASDETIRQGLEQGAVGVLEKPLDINQLLAFFTSLARNRAIVIVDDDPDFCKTIGDILQKRGFNVVLITDPHTSVETMASDSQVILLDMKLNGLNGLQLLHELRARYPSLPVVMVTGYREEMETAIRSALEINAYACLYKPLEIPALLEMLGQIQLTHLRDEIRK